MTLESGFIVDCAKRLNIYKDLGDKTLAQLTDEEMVYRPNNQTNSIAIIVQHMHGNMLSRFTNFLTEDGEKSWRSRDAEFEPRAITKQEVVNLWNAGWHCVLTTLQQLQPNDLNKTIYIRTEPLIVYDALLRQLAHYPYHVGQIIQVAKALKGEDFTSLSIAKGASEKFNKDMQLIHEK